ncbi:putative RNA-directed DNA polymerase [Helianthus annuus]|nr:putative RNA-directed DNA polymerase [Helianthus annuus]
MQRKRHLSLPHVARGSKIISSNVFMLGNGGIIAWSSKKQNTDAEYISPTVATCQAIWICKVLDLGVRQRKSTVIYYDRKSAISLSKKSSNA